MSLDALKEDLNQRDIDIEKLYSYLVRLDESNELSHILKASLFVMFYNKVEFFFREFVLSIYDEIHDQKLRFFELKPYIQHIIVDYLFPKDSNKDKKHHIIKCLFENKIEYYKPDRTDLANGNIDGELIKDVLKQYGINPSQVYCEGDIKLHTLKNIRNQLAHGEEGFRSLGSLYTIDQITKLKEDIERIFLALQDELEIFLNDKHYLAE